FAKGEEVTQDGCFSVFASMIIRICTTLFRRLSALSYTAWRPHTPHITGWLTYLSSKYKIGNDSLNPNTKRAISSAIQDANPRPSIRDCQHYHTRLGGRTPPHITVRST
ncbi:13733_t:CDS:2, partial [Funneliformis caledonium]